MGRDSEATVSLLRDFRRGGGEKYSDDEAYMDAKWGKGPTWINMTGKSPKGRAKKMAQGAASIINLWPEHVLFCWLAAVSFGIILFTCTFLLMRMTRTYNPLSTPDINKDCNDRHDKRNLTELMNPPDKTTIHLHLILNDGEVFNPDKYKSLLTSTLEHHPGYAINLYALLNDTNIPDYQRNSRFKDWELYRMGNQKHQFFHTSSESDERKIASVARINNDSILFNNPNIKLIRSTFSNYFEHSPLRNIWKTFPADYYPLIFKVLTLWEHGGVALPWKMFTDKTSSYVVDEKQEAELKELVEELKKQYSMHISQPAIEHIEKESSEHENEKDLHSAEDSIVRDSNATANAEPIIPKKEEEIEDIKDSIIENAAIIESKEDSNKTTTEKVESVKDSTVSTVVVATPTKPSVTTTKPTEMNLLKESIERVEEIGGLNLGSTETDDLSHEADLVIQHRPSQRQRMFPTIEDFIIRGSNFLDALDAPREIRTKTTQETLGEMRELFQDYSDSSSYSYSYSYEDSSRHQPSDGLPPSAASKSEKPVIRRARRETAPVPPSEENSSFERPIELHDIMDIISSFDDLSEVLQELDSEDKGHQENLDINNKTNNNILIVEEHIKINGSEEISITDEVMKEMISAVSDIFSDIFNVTASDELKLFADSNHTLHQPAVFEVDHNETDDSHDDSHLGMDLLGLFADLDFPIVPEVEESDEDYVPNFVLVFTDNTHNPSIVKNPFEELTQEDDMISFDTYQMIRGFFENMPFIQHPLFNLFDDESTESSSNSWESSESLGLSSKEHHHKNKNHYHEPKLFRDYAPFNDFNIFDQPMRDTLSLDRYGFYMAVRKPCHALLGQVITSLIEDDFNNYEEIIPSNLKIFCQGKKLSSCKGISII